MLGKIKEITTVHDICCSGVMPLVGKNNSQLGILQMISSLCGGDMDGYKIVTDKHVFHVLIDNGQSCCEDWGYLTSEDDSEPFMGAELISVNLTDTTLRQDVVEKTAPYGFGEGGIQFVDFVTDRGTFQLAVYNGHNGYYGHGILVAKDDDILLKDTI